MKCCSWSTAWASNVIWASGVMKKSNSIRFVAACAIALGSLLSTAVWCESPAISAPELRPPAGALFTPLSRAEVWQVVTAALRQKGISDPNLPKEEDLDLPVILPAIEGRNLRVASVCWDAGPRRLQFRMQCGEPGQCLPFLAYLSNASLTGTFSDAIGRARSCRIAVRSRPAPGERLAPEVAAKPAVHIGELAKAVFVSGGLRMTASVTCLERGRDGEVIRVRGLDGHVFRARVSGPARLEALPQ